MGSDSLAKNWVLLVAVGIAVGGWALREFRSRNAQSWPIVDGTVESTTVRVEGGGDHQHQTAEVNYSYKIDGEFYSGAHEVASEREFEAFPVGSRVIVHHKPSDPGVSFLDRDDLRSIRDRMMAEGRS